MVKRKAFLYRVAHYKFHTVYVIMLQARMVASVIGLAMLCTDACVRACACICTVRILKAAVLVEMLEECGVSRLHEVVAEIWLVSRPSNSKYELTRPCHHHRHMHAYLHNSSCQYHGLPGGQSWSSVPLSSCRPSRQPSLPSSSHSTRWSDRWQSS